MPTRTSGGQRIPAGAQALVKDVQRLVSFPDVWIRINRLIDAERSAAEIARTIEMDTDLCARLLRIVNSSFYNLAAPVETVTRAITIVGTLDLRDLAMLTVARRLFTGIPADLMDSERFWFDAVTTGVYAGLFGRHCHLLHAERAFVMGVIHNIGLLTLCKYRPEQARELLLIASGDEEVFCMAEADILGYSHQDVGEALLRSWKLPEGLCQVAANHHRPERAQQFELEVAIVHVAAQLTSAENLGLDTQGVFDRLHPSAVRLLQADEDMLDEVRAQGARQIEELAGQFLGNQHVR